MARLLHTQKMTIQIHELDEDLDFKPATGLPEPDKGHQILGLILSDPKAARDELAIYPACLELARRKARAGGLNRGALFCGLDPKKHPCHPDDPPVKPLMLLPGFELSSLMINYYRTSLDFEFLTTGGADVIIETARLWQEIQEKGVLTDPSEQGVLTPLIELNLKWTGRLWTMLGHAGRQQDVATRLGLTEQEIQDFFGLARQLPTDQVTPAKPSLTLDWLKQLTRAGGEEPTLALNKGLEASVLACLVTAVAGLVIEEDELSLTPVLPCDWQKYDFQLRYRGSKFKCEVKDGEGALTLTEGSAFPIIVNGLEYMLEDAFTFDLA